MRVRRDGWPGSDELEVILDEPAPAPEPEPVPVVDARRGRRRAAVLVGLVGLLGGGLGAAGGWVLASSVEEAPGDTVAAAVPTTPAPPTTAVVAPPVAEYWQDGGSGVANGPMDLLDSRVTADGITVRTYWPARDGCAGTGWCPPPECLGGSGLVVGLSTPRMVASGAGTRVPRLLAPPMYVGGWSVVGQSEGDPVLWATVAVPESAVTAELVVDGRRVDRAGVDRGWAGLAYRDGVEIRTFASTHDEGTFESVDISQTEAVARDEAGRVVGRVGLESLSETGGRLPGRCEPPAPPFDPPGEQPADPEAARAAVQAAYEQAWNHTSTRGQKLAALSDTVGVEPAMERAAAAYAQAVSTTVVVIDEVRFTSPQQAQVHFRLEYENASSLGNRLGGAVLVEGRWKVLRSSYCEVLSLAGSPCSGSG